jgi:predicted Rossmann fold nucleotide-binding protein DprA/Smf involved in DNA uptake
MQALQSVIHSHSMSDIRYWIALSQLPDVGPVRARNLLSIFGSPERVFSAGPDSLCASQGITSRIAGSIREFSAIPGNINSPNSLGTNTLIRRGAVLTRKAEDIVEELAPVLKGFIKSRDRAAIDVTGEEKKLCDLLSGEPKQVDAISRESGLPASKVLGILLGLELKGAVKQITGKRFYLA